MLDFMKRIAIALALALVISILFVGTMTTYAAEEVEEQFTLEESLIWPTIGEITDTYGTRDGSHFGIDIAAPEGTAVVSIADGTVSRSYYSNTYGEVIFIEHDNGLETVYAHLHERYFIEGQAVTEGEQIGVVGNTGRSSGNHLHFEVHDGEWDVEKSQSIDPLIVLSEDKSTQYASLSDDSTYDTDRENEEVTVVLSQYVPEEDLKLEEERTEEEKSSKTNQMNDETDQQKAGLHPPIHAVVQSGDTLWGLANYFSVEVEQLMEWNDLDSELIHTGELLVIYPEPNTHFIEQGDTLKSIAKSHQLTVEQLKEINDLEHNTIFPGELLLVGKK